MRFEFSGKASGNFSRQPSVQSYWIAKETLDLGVRCYVVAICFPRKKTEKGEKNEVFFRPLLSVARGNGASRLPGTRVGIYKGASHPPGNIENPLYYFFWATRTRSPSPVVPNGEGALINSRCDAGARVPPFALLARSVLRGKEGGPLTYRRSVGG